MQSLFSFLRSFCMLLYEQTTSIIKEEKTMMSQKKREIVAERMRRIRFDMNELQKDLKKLKDEYEAGSEKKGYLGFIISEQDSAFNEATQWFDDLIYFLENNKIMKSEEEEES